MKWKDIKGYEDNYQINEKGEVRHKVKGNILKQGIGKVGYPVVSLWKNNKGKTHSVHRLLAEHFIPNPENKREVNHKDGVKHNNNLNNLEWVTPSENLKHAHDNKLNGMSEEGRIRVSKSISKRNKIYPPRRKKVLQLNEDGQIIKEYISAVEASKENGISFSMVCGLCRGSRTSKKYKFKYKGDK